MRPKPLMPTRMVMGTRDSFTSRRSAPVVVRTRDGGGLPPRRGPATDPMACQSGADGPGAVREPGTRLRNQHVRRQVGIRPRDAVLGRLAVGHGQQTPDPTRDGVLGHWRIGELAELLQAG